MKRLRHFLRQQRGSVAVYSALTLLPVMGLWAFQLEASRYQTRQMRLHQAQAVAVQAITKEGWSVNVQAQQRLADHYVKHNLAAIHGQSQAVTLSLLQTENQIQLTAVQAYQPVMTMLGGLLWPDVQQKLSAEWVLRPTETAVVLDSSASMYYANDAIKAVRDGVTSYIHEAFRHKETSADYWVSLISYAELVNIGWSAKNKLITPESRKIPPRAYAVSRDYGWLHSDDLLHPAGPEGIRQGACVLRKDIAPLGIEGYLEKVIERPPSRSEEGFTLTMEYGQTSNIANNTWEPTRNQITSLELVSKLNAIKDIGLQIPLAAQNIYPPNRFTPRFPYNVHDMSFSVGAGLECAHMPMLVGSRSKSELIQRLQMYVPTRWTGGDEGLAWGYRTLNPRWRGVWHDAYPADYAPDKREKKLVLFTDGPNSHGYGGGNRRNPKPNIIPSLCQRMKENGIEVSILIFDKNAKNPGNSDFASGGNSSLKNYRECVSHPDLFKHVDSTADIRHFLQEWGKRKYQVRLVAS